MSLFGGLPDGMQPLVDWENYGMTPGGIYIPDAKPRVLSGVDLFAGCGGFSLGMEAAGIDMVAAVEWDPVALITYLYNLGHRNGCAVAYTDESFQEALQKELKNCQKRRGKRSLLDVDIVPGDKHWVGFNRIRHNPECEMGCRAAVCGDATHITGEMILETLAAKNWKGKIDIVVGGPLARVSALQTVRLICMTPGTIWCWSICAW